VGRHPDHGKDPNLSGEDGLLSANEARTLLTQPGDARQLKPRSGRWQ